MDAGLAVDFAIQVNENCQSSDPDIYAAGDVATQLRADGQYRRVETWENANLQAGIFARHVMGVAHPKANPAWFWTDQLEINYQFVGDMQAAQWHVRGAFSFRSSRIQDSSALISTVLSCLVTPMRRQNSRMAAGV